jgi:hypothetical protein
MPTIVQKVAGRAKAAAQEKHPDYDRLVAEGWEKLEGAAAEKAKHLFGGGWWPMDYAKKYGRKTVFLDDHGGLFKLYVTEDGKTYEEDHVMGMGELDKAARELVQRALTGGRQHLASNEDSWDRPIKPSDWGVYAEKALHQNMRGKVVVVFQKHEPGLVHALDNVLDSQGVEVASGGLTRSYWVSGSFPSGDKLELAAKTIRQYVEDVVERQSHGEGLEETAEMQRRLDEARKRMVGK